MIVKLLEVRVREKGKGSWEVLGIEFLIINLGIVGYL